MKRMITGMAVVILLSLLPLTSQAGETMDYTVNGVSLMKVMARKQLAHQRVWLSSSTTGTA